MIGSLKEATDHAKSVLHKSDFIAVLADGQIYLCETADELSKFSDAFIVKGEAKKNKKNKE